MVLDAGLVEQVSPRVLRLARMITWPRGQQGLRCGLRLVERRYQTTSPDEASIGRCLLQEANAAARGT